jgi:hypothetical protein
MGSSQLLLNLVLLLRELLLLAPFSLFLQMLELLDFVFDLGVPDFGFRSDPSEVLLMQLD